MQSLFRKKVKLHFIKRKNFSGFLGLLVLLFNTIQQCESDISFSIDTLTESVKDMMNDGFSYKEIISNIKSELSLSRIKDLIGKMYGDDGLTEEELIRLKSGEIEDDDAELVSILQKFGMNITTEEDPPQLKEAPEEELERNKSSSRERTRHKLYDENEDDADANHFPDLGNDSDKHHHMYKPDYAFSPYELGKLVAIEEQVYKPLKRYVMKVEAKLRVFKRYLNDVDKSSMSIVRNLPRGADTFQDRANAIISNPIATYKLIKRFNNQLFEAWQAAGEDYEEDLWARLSKIKLNQKPPNQQDWKDVIDSILRIQYYNGNTAKEFADGTLRSVNLGQQLNAEECAEIGIRALHLKQFDFALEWLHLAQKKLESVTREHFVGFGAGQTYQFLKAIEKPIQHAIKEHNKAWSPSHRFGKTHLFVKPITSIEEIETTEKMSAKIREGAREIRKVEEYNTHTQYNFVSLCAGENMQSEKEKSRLYCWYERSKNPYFYINPMKMELLSDDPPLVQIYEVVNDKLIREIKQNAVRRLERSQVINYSDPAADDVSLLRTSSQTWIPSRNLQAGSKLDNLLKLIEKITGLENRKWGSSEDFQVACYGTSQHYEEHLDAVQDPRRTSTHGDRIATFMIYLSSVEAGGKTAFPVLGTAANPIKGSAVFWYNLKKNGEPDKRTWHGGCPVVHGIKWIMNNWILMNANIRTRPCGLNPEE